MVFRPKNIPAGMSMIEYAEICALSMLIHTPLEVTPPVSAKIFLSRNEIKLLTCLRDWLPNFIISTQVHLLQLIKVEKDDIDDLFMKNYDYIFGDDTSKNREYAYWKIFNMVSLLSVDFVIIDLFGQPVYAIELDGPEHGTDTSLIERDKIKNHVLNSINIPLLRIANAELAEKKSLEKKVREFIK